MKEIKAHAGFPIAPVYGPDDVAGVEFDRDIGRPGEYPYTRGIHKHMYRDRVWTMRQYVGFGTPKETNSRFKYLMAHGQDALNVAFDLPTQRGVDSDDLKADGEVGRVGMAIDTLADMEEAFAGIPLDRVSVSLTINGMAAAITAMYYAVAEKQGAAADRVVTTPQNDILKEFIARGTWIYPVEPSLRLVADLIEFSAKHYPRSNPVSGCGSHIREAGCTTAQEMAYGLAIAAAYVELMQARGMAVDDFAPRISFNFTCWGKIFEEVAKFRAGRRLYARMMRERFGATNPRSWMFRSLIGGGGSAFTVQEPENNIVRGAYIALAAALSGAQTMALPTYDEAYTIPSAKAPLTALRPVQHCAEETAAGRQPRAGQHGGGPGVRHAGRERPGDERRLRRTQGACEMVSPERFAQGMTFDQCVRLVATPENLAREATRGPRKDFGGYLRAAYDAARLSPAHEAAWKWLVAQPGGPAKVLAISGERSSDCRRDMPVLARLADTVGLDLRIFTRDGKICGRGPRPEPDSPNADVMAQFLNERNGQTFQSIPVIVF